MLAYVFFFLSSWHHHLPDDAFSLGSRGPHFTGFFFLPLFKPPVHYFSYPKRVRCPATSLFSLFCRCSLPSLLSRNSFGLRSRSLRRTLSTSGTATEYRRLSPLVHYHAPFFSFFSADLLMVCQPFSLHEAFPNFCGLLLPQLILDPPVPLPLCFNRIYPTGFSSAGVEPIAAPFRSLQIAGSSVLSLTKGPIPPYSSIKP